MQNVLESLIALLTPEKCLGCNANGALLCRMCQEDLYYPDRCFSCRKPSAGGLTCHQCAKQTNPIVMQIVASGHDGLARKLVYEAKYGMAREAADTMGSFLSAKLPYLATEFIVVPIPSTQSHKRLRGYDTACRMAKNIATARSIAYSDCMQRKTKVHQVGLSREERIKNVRGTFNIKNPHAITGKTVILVDDVVTTGATMESAARSLREVGATGVIATYFVRAE